jgi:UDP-2-acetamido-3-amino-2,3-dideoxy-glucuronate N-acetyltransferase
MGTPARQVGWMSKYGYRLEFDNNNEAICPESGDQYRLEENQIIKLA